MDDLDLKEARVVHLEPGDKVVIEVDHIFDAQEVDYALRAVADRLGVDRKDVLVLVGAHLGVLRMVEPEDPS
jgi:hypothetical protein